MVKITLVVLNSDGLMAGHRIAAVAEDRGVRVDLVEASEERFASELQTAEDVIVVLTRRNIENTDDPRLHVVLDQVRRNLQRGGNISWNFVYSTRSGFAAAIDELGELLPTEFPGAVLRSAQLLVASFVADSPERSRTYDEVGRLVDSIAARRGRYSEREVYARHAPMAPHDDHGPVASPPRPRRRLNAPKTARSRPDGAQPRESRWYESEDTVERTVASVEAGSRPSVIPKGPAAQATAFAPESFLADSPELVTVVIHTARDLQRAMEIGRQSDPGAQMAGSSASLPSAQSGSMIRLGICVDGGKAAYDPEPQQWDGEPIQFGATLVAEPGGKSVVVRITVFVDDAAARQISFKRPVRTRRAKKTGPERIATRGKGYSHIFISYSNTDIEKVRLVAAAYERQGTRFFIDRRSQSRLENYKDRITQELDACDFFHLFWSEAASKSPSVEEEAVYAHNRRVANAGVPEMWVDMLEGPPFPKYPDSLKDLNWDDYDQAAASAYARARRE